MGTNKALGVLVAPGVKPSPDMPFPSRRCGAGCASSVGDPPDAATRRSLSTRTGLPALRASTGRRCTSPRPWGRPSRSTWGSSVLWPALRPKRRRLPACCMCRLRVPLNLHVWSGVKDLRKELFSARGYCPIAGLLDFKLCGDAAHAAHSAYRPSLLAGCGIIRYNGQGGPEPARRASADLVPPREPSGSAGVGVLTYLESVVCICHVAARCRSLADGRGETIGALAHYAGVLARWRDLRLETFS